MLISESMLICVGVFAFLSVYGLTLSMKKRYENYEFTNKEASLFVVRRYIAILAMFLIPFLFCEIVTHVMGFTGRYGEGRTEQAGNFLMDMLGLGDIFGTKMMVGAWWYISFLVVITVFMPMVIRGYKHYGWLLIPMFLIPGQLFLNNNVNMTKWLFAVPLAVCFADGKVLERLKAFSLVRISWLNKLLKFLISTVILLVLFKLRASAWGKEYLQFALNGFIPAIFIYWSYEFIIELPVLKQILIFLGRHSADIFFIHSFIRGIWYRKESYSFHYAGLILLVLLGASLGISIVLDIVRRLIRYDRGTKIITDKTLGWMDKIL